MTLEWLEMIGLGILLVLILLFKVAFVVGVPWLLWKHGVRIYALERKLNGISPEERAP